METLNAEQVAELLCCSKTHIETLARNGKLPAVQFGRSWCFHRGELEEHIRKLVRLNIKPETPKLVQKKRYPVL